MTIAPARLSIADSIRAAATRGPVALLPFIPAGYPTLAALGPCLIAAAEAGAAAIEIGLPFSDPVADGPVIQEAFTHALAAKLKIAQVLEAVKASRSAVPVPLLAMVSFSIVYRRGPRPFFQEAAAAGLDGVIIPDLPPPEAAPICDLARSCGLDTVLLVAPTTPSHRRGEIARLCSGFVYYLSVSGITGERDSLPPDVAVNVREIRQLTDKPICVGFGIHRPEQLVSLRGVADGAIVGSAIVRRMRDAQDGGPAAIARSIGQYCRTLLGT
jgi:tryptophan synthase alpha chain